MIIKNNELQKLKATKSNLYLLYGENRGFKNQFINNNLSPEFKENIFKYNENEIFNDYNNFITSILNKSFFEKKKLYIISNVSEKILKLVEDFTSSNIEDITIIILASTFKSAIDISAPIKPKPPLITTVLFLNKKIFL